LGESADAATTFPGKTLAVQTSNQNHTDGSGDPRDADGAAHQAYVSGLLWTRRQRLTLAVVLLPVAGWLVYLATTHRLQIANPLKEPGQRSGELATRIDPNKADWPALAALPVLGEKMAKAIVTYREAHDAQATGEPAFGELNDLMQVKGIGKATTRALEPLLVFPERPELIRDPK